MTHLIESLRICKFRNTREKTEMDMDVVNRKLLDDMALGRRIRILKQTRTSMAIETGIDTAVDSPVLMARCIALELQRISRRTKLCSTMRRTHSQAP